MRNKFVAAAAFAVLLLGAGWYWVSPSWALSQLRDAAVEGDADALSDRVDFPALRESLKTEMVAKLAAEAQKDTSGFGGLGLALGSTMINAMIDGLVSPAGVRQLLAARPATDQVTTEPTTAEPEPDYAIEREGLSKFSVVTENDRGAKLVFVRHGLGWKLSGVEFPAEPTHP